MEYIKLKNIEFNQIEKYEIFKSKLNNIIDLIKQNRRYENLLNSLDSIHNIKNNYIMIVLFQNYDKLINFHLGDSYNYNSKKKKDNTILKIFKIETIVNESDKGINNIYDLLIKWLYFLYIQLINNLYLEPSFNICEINKIRYLIKETMIILITLYKSKIFKSGHIFNILYFLLFLIESNSDIIMYTDNLYKIKNCILLKNIFFLFKEIIILIFKKININYDDVNNNKNEIESILKFFEDLQNNKEINSIRNIIIINNENILFDFMNSILKIIDMEIISKYNRNFKNKLINFYSNFIKNNLRKSKIFDIFINNLKYSFFNLYDFDNNQTKYLHDFFVQSFYLKLVKKIFIEEEKSNLNNTSSPQYSTFYFNGFDSEISLNIKGNKLLEKSSLFFSFNILAINSKEIYPLFMIEKAQDKKGIKEKLFSIYLKKNLSNNCEEYDLYIYKDDKEMIIDKFPKFVSNYIYYFNITFNDNRVYISLFNGKNDIIQIELEKNKKLFDKNFNIIFGFNRKEGKYYSFSGYIGPIIIIKNIPNSKDFKINNLIALVLKMQNYYPYFLFIKNNANYSFEYFNHFKNHSIINNTKKYYDKIESTFECFLYLTPELFRFVNNIKEEKDTLPDIGIICPNQKDYIINNVNTTLVKNEWGIVNFVWDNGLNYICLLYEYIYQFIYNYFEKQNNNFFEEESIITTIISIYKKSLFILEKIYSEIKVHNLNKSLKQLYMNLFSSIKLISKKYYIIDELINFFFSIMMNYCGYILALVNKRKNESNIDIVNTINNELKINISFLSGFLDFLLSPELYDFNKTETLKKLFVNLTSFFNPQYLEGEKETSQILNQHFYLRLINFSKSFNNFFEQHEPNAETEYELFHNEISNNICENINDDKNLEEKKEVLNCYFKTLERFFHNNPSKSENIINLQNIFNYINETLSKNYQIGLSYYTFIKELIEDDPDFYFNDDNNEEQIKILILYLNKYSKNFAFDEIYIKDKNIIKQKRSIFNKILAIIMRIIFTKKRINKSTKLIQEFKRIIQNVDLSIDLITEITEEIKKIIEISIGVSQKCNNTKSNIDKNEEIYTSNDLKYISNFYYEIFNLIIFFLEYPIDNSNIKDSEFVNIYEEKLFELIEFIEEMIKGNIENYNNKMDIENENNIIVKGNNGLFTIDTIYCLIHFVKFYNSILNKKFYPDKYINSFIKICNLCCKSCLINSNILVDLENSSKTILEIILDICLNYIFRTSKFYFEPTNIEETNNVKKEDIKKQQINIYQFLSNIFPKLNDKSKDVRKKNTIFFHNDYLRFISENLQNKKFSKKYSFSLDFLNEFHNYKIINNYLLNEQKFNYNFTTFFLIKLTGYYKILDSLDAKINSMNLTLKDILKYNDSLELIKDTINNIYKEQDQLFALNKDFFFKSKKANSSKFCHYREVKTRIEHCIKNINDNKYSQIDFFLKNKIFKIDYDNIFNSIYSGLCKSDNKSLSFSIFQSHKLSDDLQENEKNKGLFFRGNGKSRISLSSTNVVNFLEEEGRKQKTQKSLFKKVKSISPQNPFQKDNKNLEIEDNNSNNIIITDENNDEDSEFFLDETPSSETNSNPIIESSKIVNTYINKKENLFNSPPSQDMRRRIKTHKTTKISSFNLNIFDNKVINLKKERTLTIDAIMKDKEINNSNNNGVPYINFFDEPDECYLKNAKKELMMNIFSINFFDCFFYNYNFQQLKSIYLQNFEGVQMATKKLDYPSKMKHFNNGLEPNLFLKPFNSFFSSKIFPINHKYFYEFMINNKISLNQIILYKKKLPEFNLKEQFDKKCELIKADQAYYGHVIGSKKHNFIAFEELDYEFYEEKNNIINQTSFKENDLDDLFTLSLVSKRPLNKNQEKVKKNLKNILKKKKNKDKKIVIILFNEIEEILERRFLLMWQALEIYLKNGKSYFFNFLTKNRCKFILELFKKNNLTKDKIHEKKYFKSQKYIKDEWIKERLSTNEYLLFINKYSSRTFNDSNQYPIFPWLIKKYSTNQKEKDEIRNLKYPMAAQNEATQKIATDRFTDDEVSKHKFQAHFGTHYSTSAYIYFYLMREEPYTSLLVKFQGYKQENPDRMFYSLEDVLSVLQTGHDNREMIPDLFYKIEHFINLNCTNFGKKNKELRVDDFIPGTNKLINNKNNKIDIYKFVKFVLDNKKLLDETRISININDWLDNIFGVGQLPDKNRKKSLNIFYKETYEQKTNLHKKLLKYQKNNKKKIGDIIKKITNKIDLIISFGQTPYQLFNEKHPKYGKKTSNNEEDFEFELINGVWNKNMKVLIDIDSPLFFIINDDLGNIFLIDKNRNLEIIDTTLFDQKTNENYQFKKYAQLHLPHIKFFNKIENDYYIYKQKYCISSFNYFIDFNQSNIGKESDIKQKQNVSKGSDKKDKLLRNLSEDKAEESENNNIKFNDCNDNDYISYYNYYINKLNNDHIEYESKKSKKVGEYFRFITCRYIDNTFKIYNLPRNNSNFKKDYLPMSFVCEDFVNSCCSISHNKFLIGLKNGKLIQWTIEEKIEDFSSKKQNIKSKINIKFNKQIQAHKGAINVIEKNNKLGLIITAGNDNYVFIRKIYDLELLTPIKFKSKYIITLAKVSPMNFLYIMCFSKTERKSRIFGYTLNGLLFAKSNYDLYDTIDFTKSGNIVTWIHKKELQILYGYSLKKINANNKELQNIHYQLSEASWIKFNYFINKNEKDSNIKIITYINKEKNKTKQMLTLDVTKIKYFD